MTDAQSDNDIELSTGLIEFSRLQNRIAHRHADRFTFCGNADLGLGNLPDLAGYAVNLEVVLSQNLRKDLAFSDQTHTGGNADLTRADLARKLHDLLHSGKLSVAFKLDFGGSLHHLRVLCFAVNF